MPAAGSQRRRDASGAAIGSWRRTLDIAAHTLGAAYPEIADLDLDRSLHATNSTPLFALSISLAPSPSPFASTSAFFATRAAATTTSCRSERGRDHHAAARSRSGCAMPITQSRPGRNGLDEFTVENNAAAIAKFVRRLVKDAGGKEVRACYEAGTCGFTLQRRIEAAGAVVCEVVARSLIPRKPGERIKTDRRDAKKLAELYRAGALTMVSPPTMEQEAVRDLCRCREDARIDLTRCRHRLVKMLVRRGHVFAGTSRLWTARHLTWLDGLVFDDGLVRVTVEQYKMAIDQAERRLHALNAQLEHAAELPLHRERVGWLRCFHGIDTIIAMIFVAEVYGIERFDSPRKLAGYLGLVPSLYETGGRGRAGSITKTGNKHVRRVLLQAAWLYMRRSTTSRAVRERRVGQPEEVISIAETAKARLTGRFQRLLARGKNRNKVVVAIMRELVGFLWAALRVPSKAARHGARSPRLRGPQ